MRRIDLRCPARHIPEEQTFFYVLPLALIFFLGAGLRFYHLASPSLWIDEAFCSWFMSHSWSGLLNTLHIDGGNLPAYFVINKALTDVIGRDELGLRFFSALASSLGIILAMNLGRMVGGRAGSLAAGWFWAFSPMATWYARDAKPYAFASVLALALLIVYLAMQGGRNGPLRWAAVALLVIGSLSHYYFFLVIMAMILFAAAEMRRRPKFFRHWVGLTLVSLVALALWLGWFFSQPTPSLGIGWIQQPLFTDPLATLWNLFSGYGSAAWSDEATQASTAFGALVVLLCGIGLSGGLAKWLSRNAFVFGILFPVAAVWVVSQRRPIYMDRYFIVLLPFVALMVAVGASRLWGWLSPRLKPASFTPAFTASLLAVALVVGFWAGWQVQVADHYTREDWRGLANQMLVEGGNGKPSLWFSDPEGVIPFEYYYPAGAGYLPAGPPPICQASCWYVMRQPYTATHAFAQGVADPDRPWLPALPERCVVSHRWQSVSGVALWKVACKSESNIVP